MANERDLIGMRGEAIITLRLTDGESPRFKPTFLGDKWSTIDFVVELDQPRSTATVVPFFFMSVRSTRSGGYTRTHGRLRVQVKEHEIRRLAAYPAPTYIVGVDEARERAFIVSANGENLGGLSSMTTRYPIDQSTREMLWSEVTGYWSRWHSGAMQSQLIDEEWR